MTGFLIDTIEMIDPSGVVVDSINRVIVVGLNHLVSTF